MFVSKHALLGLISRETFRFNEIYTCICYLKSTRHRVSRHVSVYLQSFERAMKFSHEEAHIWTQYALCLISMGRYMHAYRVLKIVARLSPQKIMPCLLAARLCYEQLNMVNRITLCLHIHLSTGVSERKDKGEMMVIMISNR